MEQRLADIDLALLTAGRSYYRSPAAWEDEVLYCLTVDRFSDGRETNYLDNYGRLVLTGQTPLFHAADRGNATATEADRQRWLSAGEAACGGTFKGLEQRIGYLKRLGVTAICVSAPEFSEDLVAVVRTAHLHGLRVILDGIDSRKAIQEWIALADIDGACLDGGITPIHEFAQSIGKENFFTGFDEAQERLDFLPESGSLAALAFRATTQRVPGIDAGSEQLFDRAEAAMFGGEFGAFESRGRHFFDETAFLYRELSKILLLRRQNIVMRRGRQYLREISGDGVHFGLPHPMGGDAIRSVVGWSRIFNGQEVVLAVNTDTDGPRSAWITIDANLQAARTHLTYQYSTDASQIGVASAIERRNGRAVQVILPAAGFAILS